MAHAPLAACLLILGFFIVFVQSSAVISFFYTVF